MKRFLISIMTLLMCANMSFAQAYKCVAPYDLSHGVSRFMSNITGSNFIGEQVAQAVMKKSMARNIQGKMSANLNAYSVKDLKKGIFKSFTVKGKNVVLDGVYFSNLKMSTLCNFNYVALERNKKPVFKEDLPMAFEAVFSEDDINQTMKTSSYKKIIEDLNKFGGSWGIFSIYSSEVKIKDGKFYYIMKVAIPFVKSVQNVVLQSDLKVANGEIDFANTKLVNENLMVDLKKIDKIINYINPLDFSLDILENKRADLTVSNVYMENDKVYSDGYIIIPKD